MKNIYISIDDYKLFKNMLKTKDINLSNIVSSSDVCVNIQLTANPVSNNRCYYSELEQFSDANSILRNIVQCDIDDLTYEAEQEISKKSTVNK